MKKDRHEEKNWRNVASIIIENRKGFRKLLTDEEQRIRIQFFCVYIIFCVVSSFMTVVNIITGWYLLMLSTLVFAVVSFANILMCLFSKKTELLSRYFFAVEMFALFTFFCICGEPEGFSAIWIALLPACGLLLYRLKFGIAMSLFQFIVLIFLFWTKTGNSLLQFEYTASFMMRFPLLYFAFFMVGIFFEYIRSATQKELVETREKFEYLSYHDILTGISNRFGFNNDVDEILGRGGEHRYALSISDIDDFKHVNDTYGHYSGDIVLKEVAKIFVRNVGDNGKVSRWGGEEFAVLFTDGEKAQEICEKILNEVRAREFDFNARKCRVTISTGLLSFNTGDNNEIARIFTTADANLYNAKNTGKNKIVASKL